MGAQAAIDDGASTSLHLCRYHTVEVPLSLTSLASIPGQPLLTALPGTFVAMQLQPLLTDTQARLPSSGT